MLAFIDDDEIAKFERQLKRLNDRGLPFATLATLNEAVMGGRERLRHNIARKFTVRNKWTAGGMQYRKARGLDIGAQAAQLGSASEYMAEQEEGFTRRARGRHGAPIPTPAAAGQGSARKRTRPVRRAMRMSSIRLHKRPRGGLTRKQRNIVAIREAIQSGRRMVFLESSRSAGIYKIRGGRKNKSGGWPKGAKLNMIWSLERKSYRVKPHVWLDFEAKRTAKLMPDIYRRRLRQQLARIL